MSCPCEQCEPELDLRVSEIEGEGEADASWGSGDLLC